MPGKQQIPRPAAVRPGEAPSWAALDPADLHGISIDHVRRAMASVGPADPVPQLPYEASPAAVLVPLFEEDGETRIILTRRAGHLRSHTGEVAFPGGRLDKGESPLAAALREAAEEVGIDTSAVDILGQLAPLATMSSRAGITPFVGVLPARPVLHPSPDEVELAFDVALAELLVSGVYREERWDSPLGLDRPMHFFELPDDTVWGATARILHELLDLVVLSGRTGPPRSER